MPNKLRYRATHRKHLKDGMWHLKNAIRAFEESADVAETPHGRAMAEQFAAHCRTERKKVDKHERKLRGER